MDTQYRIGINYWPSSSAMRWWREFDRSEVDRDFGKIAAAGADSVRVFLLWADFQPSATSVSEMSLARLVEVADVASSRGLRIVPTLFTGHMSGVNWIPQWALGRPGATRFPTVSGDDVTGRVPLNWYAEPAVGEAQALVAHEAAAALRGHPALWAWDLGNENSNVCVPESRDLGRAWLSRITSAIRNADASARITIGLHMEDLEEDRRIGPAEAAEVSDFLCMHGYPLYASWARSSVDPLLPAYLAAVTRWLGAKDVFFEEFGMPAGTTAEEDAADMYTAGALDALHEAGTTGAMLWCFADYAPAIWDRAPFTYAPHERFFGLWRADGSAKPAVRHLGRYVGVQRRSAPRESPWADVPRERFYDDPAANLRRMYARYVPVGALPLPTP
jgi:endo-1,4-beta-mannosidase